jgi:hypothetical protein
MLTYRQIRLLTNIALLGRRGVCYFYFAPNFKELTISVP